MEINLEYKYSMPTRKEDPEYLEARDGMENSLSLAVPHSAKIMNQIRKWICLNGTDPLAFLERMEELCQGYGYSVAIEVTRAVERRYFVVP